MSIWERVQAALLILSIPIVADEYIIAGNSDLPDVYLRHFMVSDPPQTYADNSEKSRLYTVQVTVYSRTGLTNLPDITGAMTAAGFVHGNDTQLPYEPSTRHYGLAMEYHYYEG